MNAFLGKVYTAILHPIILLLFAAAFVIFVGSLAVFIKNKDSEEGRATGWRVIFYGILGMVIMVSVFGIINIIAGTIGVSIPVNTQQIQRDIDKIDVKTEL